MLKVESLYFGDMRLDTLKTAIVDLIMERTAGQQIPIVSIIGILYLVQRELHEMMDTEEGK